MMLFLTFNAKAQNFSYANLIKMTKISSLSEATSMMRQFGYKFSENNEHEGETFVQFVCSQNRNYKVDVSFDKDNSVASIIWYFTGYQNYTNMLAECKKNGWKFEKDEITSYSICSTYVKEGTDHEIDVDENTIDSDKSQSYSITYYVKL